LGSHHIQVQRLAGAAWLLGAIENRDLLDGQRESREKMLD
jgi:hypothetical protein